MIIALLLAASAPTDYTTSRLVELPHTHDWEFLAEEEGAKVWWDMNAIGKASIANEDYPTILMRAISQEDHWMANLFEYQDIIAAIDCQNNQIAEIDEIRNGQRVDDPWADVRPEPSFSPLPDQQSKEIKTMVRLVCEEAQ